MHIPRLGRLLGAFAAGCTICLFLPSAPAAQPPVYKDAERAGRTGRLPPPPEVIVQTDQVCCNGVPGGLRRPVTGGVGYVGSVRGLGRPSYDGLWPPPGYGSYRESPPH